MTDKEATVYIVDIGLSMGKKHNGRNISDLDWSLVYLWDKITSIIALERRTTFQSVIALRSDITHHDLKPAGDWPNIEVLEKLDALQRYHLQSLQTKLVPSKTDRGDAVDAIVIAIQMITAHCKKLKYKRRIVLVTNGQGKIDSDQLDDIAEKLKEESIELVVLGVDFDDNDYGFKEEDKSEHKLGNEKLLKKLADDSDGVYGTLAQAIEELGQPRVKTTKPMASYKGQLSIGDPKNTEKSVIISVERYPKVMVRKPNSAKTVRLASNNPQTQSSTTLKDDDGMDLDGLDGDMAIKSERRYYIEDENEPGSRKDIEYNELVRGYEYGRSIVPISETEQDVTRLDTEPCLDIIGFVSKAEFPREMLMTTSHIIVPLKNDSESSMALSSLAHALLELEDYAIARFVSKQNKAPLVVLLAPLIEPDYEYLVELELPFAEDVRSYRFAPLDRILTVTGNAITQHARLPNDDLKEAMSNYVDRMDLTTFGDDDEGNPSEYAPITEVFSPLLHRLDQVIRYRATHPDTTDIPAPYPILVNFSHPPSDLIAAADTQLSALKAAAALEKVPPKTKARKAKTTAKPISGLDIASILEPASSIDKNNSIPSFERMVDPPSSTKAPDPDRISRAAKGLGKVILDRIKDSFGSSAYDRALEEMGHLRKRMDELEEPELWNEFLGQIRDSVKTGDLKDRVEFWFKVRAAGLGSLFVEPRSLNGVSEKELSEAKGRWETEEKEFWKLK